MLKLLKCTLSVAFPLSFLMVDSPFEIVGGASGQISAKDFEKHIEVGGGRVAAASGQSRKGTFLSQCSTASGETRCGVEEVEDSASEAESEKDSKAKCSEVSAGADLPVIFPAGQKVPSCFLCGLRADSQSPLSATEAMDGYGNFVPWPSYRKIYGQGEDGTQCAIGKMPKGCVCLMSLNCFRAIGYKAKYGSTSNYKKLIAKRRCCYPPELSGISKKMDHRTQ